MIKIGWLPAEHGTAKDGDKPPFEEAYGSSESGEWADLDQQMDMIRHYHACSQIPY